MTFEIYVLDGCDVSWCAESQKRQTRRILTQSNQNGSMNSNMVKKRQVFTVIMEKIVVQTTRNNSEKCTANTEEDIFVFSRVSDQVKRDQCVDKGLDFKTIVARRNRTIWCRNKKVLRNSTSSHLRTATLWK